MRIRKPDVKLVDLLDLEELQSIQDSLANLSGLSIVIFDPPVVSKERIEDTAYVVYRVAMAIASKVYQRMTHQRRADKAAADLLQRTQELTILNRTAALVLESGDPREVLRQVLEEAQKAIDAD